MSLVLENSFMRLAVDPAAGGKITSLRSSCSSREWLWSNPHLRRVTPVYGMSYVEALDTGGWDEILPSVSPCQIGGLSIPDHGDLVSLPRDVVSASAECLEMSVTTRFAPCRFTRVLALEDETLRVSYTLENLGNETVPWLWCAHPLIAIEPGMLLGLPEGIQMRVDGGVGIPTERGFSWPHLEGLPRFDTIRGEVPFAIKMFTAAGSIDEVSITSADRCETLRFAWDRDELPFLGLWLNCGAWSGCGSAPYFNLGLEPATAPFDSLADAIRDRSARHLAPGEIRSWSLQLTLTSKPEPASPTCIPTPGLKSSPTINP